MTPYAALTLLTLAAAGPNGPGDVGKAANERRAADVRSTESADLAVPVLHGLALMSVMRATETVLWPQPFAEPQYFLAHYEEAYTKPPKFDSSQPFMRWDGDPLFINVVGHGLFGSELYVRARQCRLGWAGALLFTTLGSGVWEYVFEANGVRPSAGDLVYTPLAGLALGEMRYALHRAAGAVSSPPTRTVLRAIVDPFGELERAAGTGC